MKGWRGTLLRLTPSIIAVISEPLNTVNMGLRPFMPVRLMHSLSLVIAERAAVTEIRWSQIVPALTIRRGLFTIIPTSSVLLP